MWKYFVIGVAVFFRISAPVAAQSQAEKQWGGLLDDLASLTWAEKNCGGRASDSVRELRLYIRKHANAEFEEAIIRRQTDDRDSIDSNAPYLSERETVQALCVGINYAWGEHGSVLPGLWKDNRSSRGSPSAQRRPADLGANLGGYGQFVWVLSLIEQMKARCDGYPSALAHEFIRVFTARAGEAVFKNRARLAPDQSPEERAQLCEAIDNTYGHTAKQWPTLWHGRIQQIRPEDRFPSPQAKQIPPALKPAALSSTFRHGVLRLRAAGEAIAPFSVTTSPGANYFVKLVRPSDFQEQVAAFMVGGEPFSMKVPAGSYELRYAVGQEWVNEQEFFGSQTIYYKADTLLVFSIEGNQVRGTSVELILQRGGNLRTSTVGKNNF